MLVFPFYRWRNWGPRPHTFYAAEPGFKAKSTVFYNHSVIYWSEKRGLRVLCPVLCPCSSFSISHSCMYNLKQASIAGGKRDTGFLRFPPNPSVPGIGGREPRQGLKQLPRGYLCSAWQSSLNLPASHRGLLSTFLRSLGGFQSPKMTSLP